jgi:hypothetical protein
MENSNTLLIFHFTMDCVCFKNPDGTKSFGQIVARKRNHVTVKVLERIPNPYQTSHYLKYIPLLQIVEEKLNVSHRFILGNICVIRKEPFLFGNVLFHKGMSDVYICDSRRNGNVTSPLQDHEFPVSLEPPEMGSVGVLPSIPIANELLIFRNKMVHNIAFVMKTKRGVAGRVTSASVHISDAVLKLLWPMITERITKGLKLNVYTYFYFKLFVFVVSNNRKKHHSYQHSMVTSTSVQMEARMRKYEFLNPLELAHVLGMYDINITVTNNYTCMCTVLTLYVLCLHYMYCIDMPTPYYIYCAYMPTLIYVLCLHPHPVLYGNVIVIR